MERSRATPAQTESVGLTGFGTCVGGSWTALRPTLAAKTTGATGSELVSAATHVQRSSAAAATNKFSKFCIFFVCCL